LERRLRSIPFFIKLPLILALGIVIVDITIGVISIFYIGNLTFVFVGLISYALLLARFISEGKVNKQNIRKLITDYLTLPSAISFLAIVLIVSHFSFVAGYMGWPPQGDIIAHGLLTSLLVHNGALQTTLTPINPSSPWFEPIGLHTLAATFSHTFQIFPAVAVFVVGTTVIILIVLLVYSIIYMLTRSIVFAALGLMSCFYVSSANSLEYWLVGIYYNGPYANLFGLLALLVYVAVQFAVSSVNNISNIRGNTILVLTSIFGILVIYPPLSFLPVIYFIASRFFLARKIVKFFSVSLRRRYNVSKGIRTLRSQVIIAIALLIVVGLIAFALSRGYSELDPLIDGASSVPHRISEIIQRLGIFSFHYSFSLNNLVQDLQGILIILTMMAAIISIIKRQYIYISSFYLWASGMLVLSSWDLTSDYLWFILPRRIFIFVSVLMWIMLLVYIKLAITWLISTRNLSISIRQRTLNPSILKYCIVAGITVPIALFFLPYLISHATLEEADQSGAWFPRSEFFRNDYNILVWMNNNIDPNDLIMVDNSLTSLYINSLSLKNLTTTISVQSNIQRAFENQIVWERPELLEEFIERYDVKYVVLLTPSFQRSLINLGGDAMFHFNKYTNLGYRSFFDNMPFLESIAQYGDATVYKVNMTQNNSLSR
jgi:hypothetical protein